MPQKGPQPFPSLSRIPGNYNYQSMMKKHELKHASVQFRTDLLRRRANAAYQNEYDRVNSMLHHHLLHNTSPDYNRLTERKEHLKKLASQAMYPEHDIYKHD
jgi:hypothetical protein